MNKKLIGFLLSLLLVLAVLVGVKRNVNAQGEDPEMPPVDQIIVKYKEDANLQQAAQAQDGLDAAAGTHGMAGGTLHGMQGPRLIEDLPECR